MAACKQKSETSPPARREARRRGASPYPVRRYEFQKKISSFPPLPFPPRFRHTLRFGTHTHAGSSTAGHRRRTPPPLPSAPPSVPPALPPAQALQQPTNSMGAGALKTAPADPSPAIAVAREPRTPIAGRRMRPTLLTRTQARRNTSFMVQSVLRSTPERSRTALRLFKAHIQRKFQHVRRTIASKPGLRSQFMARLNRQKIRASRRALKRLEKAIDEQEQLLEKLMKRRFRLDREASIAKKAGTFVDRREQRWRVSTVKSTIEALIDSGKATTNQLKTQRLTILQLLASEYFGSTFGLALQNSR